jgi:F0F1-type ATP synthase assembly protein I
MSAAQNFKNFAGNMQHGAKNASLSLLQRSLRILSGFFIGVVLALITQEFTQNGTLVLVFLTIMFMLVVYKILRSLSIWQIIIFDVICILVANTLRMYIMMAP